MATLNSAAKTNSRKIIDGIIFWVFCAITLGIICYGVYGVYLVGKSFTYSFFYEDMVRNTIEEMVKLEYLKK